MPIFPEHIDIDSGIGDTQELYQTEFIGVDMETGSTTGVFVSSITEKYSFIAQAENATNTFHFILFSVIIVIMLIQLMVTIFKK